MPHVTEEEKQKVADLVAKIRAWIEENVEAQSKLSPYESPAFTSNDVLAQMKPLTLQFDKLLKKPKPEPKKVGYRVVDHFHFEICSSFIFCFIVLSEESDNICAGDGERH